MGNSGISVNKSQAMRTADVDIITPLSSRALYWRLRYSADSAFLGYMPFLFWLVETVLPNVTVCLGVNAAVPYFGVCQAVDKLGLGSTCFGFEPQNAAVTEVLADDVVVHNRQFYADFSQIEAIDLREAATRIGKARVDMLVVNLPVDDALIAVLDACWLPLLSDSAVVLFSAGVRPGAEGDYSTFIERIGAKAGAFLFGQPDHVAFVLYGDDHPDRLRHLAQLQLGQPPYLQVRQVFERLGEAYAQAWRLTALAAEIEREREARDALVAAVDERTREVEALRNQVVALQKIEGEKTSLESRLESRLASQDSWINDLETLVMEAEAAAAAEKAEKLAALAAVGALEAKQERDAGMAPSEMDRDVAVVAALEARLADSERRLQVQIEIAEQAERERMAVEARLAETEARLPDPGDNSSPGDGDRERLESGLAESEALLRTQADLLVQHETERAAFEARLAESDVLLQAQTALVDQRERDIAALATLLDALENSPAPEPAEAPVQPGMAELESELAAARAQCDVALKHLERLTFENAALKSRVQDSHGDLHAELAAFKTSLFERERDIAALGELLSASDKAASDKGMAPPVPAASGLLPIELDSMALTLAEYVETIEQLSNQLEAAEASNASVVPRKNADYLSQEAAALKALNATLSSENADLRDEMQEARAGLELELALHQHELVEREKDIAALGDMLYTLEKNMLASPVTATMPQGGLDPRLIEMKDRLAARQMHIADILTGSQFSADYLALRPVLDEQVFAISRSGQFDVAWYRKAHPGTTGLLYDILRHFVRKGTFAGENPGAGFDTLRYYVDYPDVAEAGLCAFAHYLMRGKAEGRIAHRVQG